MKKLFCLFILSIFFLGCQTYRTEENKENGQRDLYRLLSESSRQRYSVWMHGNHKDYSIMYYSDADDYDLLYQYDRAMSCGGERKHLIYYVNKTSYNNLGSLIFLGFYEGDPAKPFSFTVEDMKGHILFQSPEYRFDEFPLFEEPRKYVEFPVNLRNVPGEIIIKVQTDSTKENGLFLVNIPNKTNSFSYQYASRYDYIPYGNSNAAIFPRFVK